MSFKVLTREEDIASGTSFKGYLNATYNQLIKAFGEPTYPNESGDGKVQFEWVFEYNGEPFTVYDWKTYDREYTINGLTRWNVGGSSNAERFISTLKSKLK